MLIAYLHKLGLLLLFFSTALPFPVGTAEAAHQGSHVLVLNSYHQGYPWSDNIMEGIREVFEESGLRVDISFEYMDTQQYDPARVFPHLEKLYRAKFTEHRKPFDLIIISDNSALDFILPRRELLAPGVPIVFTGINDYEDQMLAGEPRITGVAEDFDLLAVIDAAISLHPGFRNLAVISDATPTGQVNLEQFLQIKPALPDWLHTLELIGLTAAELQEELRGLPPRTFVLYLSFYRDSTGQVFSAKESMELLLESSQAPIYTAWGFPIEKGALGGIVVSGHIQGREAARMAVEILRGMEADETPILRESPNVPMFNYVQMRRFGLNAADLPPGSIIVNEPETFYHQYWQLIWAALLMLILQMFVITGLIVNILRRRRAEMKLSEYQEHLEELVRKRTAALEAANSMLQEEMAKQQQTEVSLRESEEKYRSLVERANDGIFIVQEDRLKYANPEMAALLDYTQEKLPGLELDEILPVDFQAVLKERHRRRVAGEKMPRKYETVLVNRSGTRIEVEFSVGLIQYGGHPASLVFVRDIRERRQLEEERAKLGKLESIGVLAGGIAHDFNNLLTGMLGNVSFARMLVESGSKTASLLDNAEKISLRARDLAQQLITFSEGGAPRMKKVELDKLLTQTVTDVLNGTTIRSSFRFPDDLHPVEADPEQIRQLIAILVLNAREAMHDQGEIQISSSNVELTANEVNRLPSGNYVKFTCTDSGGGILPENLAKIFDPYFSTKEMGRQKGMGLGLSIAHSIVRRHGGHIEVQSQVGRGTTISVHLPAILDSFSTEGEPGERGRILIVAGEPVVREVVSEMARHLGYAVEEATGGEQALTLFRHYQNRGNFPDAVIMDLDARGPRNTEVARRMLALAPQTLIIAAIDSPADERAVEKLRQQGFKAVVHKPYQLREIAALLDSIKIASRKASDPGGRESSPNE